MTSLIISDIHGNLAALEAVLAQEQNWDEVIFLGDAIVAGPQPEHVLQRLAKLKGIWILGNHDVEPFERDFKDDEVDPDLIYMRWTRDQVSAESRRFVASFEPTRVIERDGLQIRLHHGFFPRPLGKIARAASLPRGTRWLYRKICLPEWDSRIWPDTDVRIFRAIAEVFSEPYVFLAHSHIQFSVQIDGTMFINPGSVGNTRLGQPIATYALLDNGNLELRAVPYDVEATCRALDAVPLEAAFIADWKAAYRSGRLPERYGLRDWKPLIEQGHR